jgi:hypothetical protein
MTKTPDREIREITAELYERFGCAGAPRARTARLLEQIDLAADKLVQERDEAEARADDYKSKLEDAWGGRITP